MSDSNKIQPPKKGIEMVKGGGYSGALDERVERIKQELQQEN